MVDRINELNPIKDTKSDGYFQAKHDYFQTTDPYRGAGFLYDSVMSVALGKCKSSDADRGGRNNEKKGENNINNPNRNLQRNSRAPKLVNTNRNLQRRAPKFIPHVKGIFDSTFHGATGKVAFSGEEGGYRSLDTLMYGVYNFRSKWDNATETFE